MRGRSLFSFIALIAIAFGGVAFEGSARGDSAVDFARDIKPILDTSCVSCHGPQKQKGGLRLDVKSAAMKGGTSGVTIVPGKGKDSPLVHRVLGLGDEDRMPLKKDPLTERQVQLITAWIDQGARWPEEAGAQVVEAKHWSFVKPVRPEVPKVTDAAWVRNPIDAFVLARLEKEGIKPSPEAPKETLIRRVSLDLTGLPPTPKEIVDFLKDESPGAYERVVDRLLASPHYGERWGRHWLDGARYADSSGYSIDAPRSMWAYRDWVIAAMNADMPFDQFTIEQIAGDLLPKATTADRIATGFHRNTQINQEGGIDPEQFRVEANIDRVNTTGTVWLGLTIGCAQCHNHKFDPIAQKEYYRLFAFFNSEVFDPKKPDEPKLKVEGLGVKGQGSGKKTGKAPSAKKGEVDTSTTLVMAELAEPRETHVFTKGDFTRPAEVVTPGVPAVLHPMKARGARADRLDLAKWLVDPENPLTARVTVNRMWMQYFGKGIVETENDFGTQGDKPTHPELLDWLATEFMRQHWSMKAMHRLIVTSATYRQSSNVRPELANADPLNKLLARQARVRLDAEIVRDVGLAASGLLCEKIGGPSVYPPQPDGVMALGQVKKVWKVSEGEDRYRRGMYTFLYRATPHPLLTAFDAPDATSACTRRLRSNTPLQALTLLNDEAFMEFAQGLARRILKEGPGDDAGRIEYGFRLCAGRRPDAAEAKVLSELFARELQEFAADKGQAKEIVGKAAGAEPERLAAWTMISRVLLNLDETITRE